MIKKRIYITYIVFFTMTLAQAQKFTIYGGANFGTFKNKSFNEFADSYNDYLSTSSVHVTDLKPLKTAYGFNAGVAFYMPDFAIGLSYNISRFRAVSFSELSYGKRYVEHIVRCPFNFGFPINIGALTIHPKFGVTNTDILTYMKYNDGTISYGGEKLLNGKYAGFGFIGELAIEIDIAPEDFPVAISIGFAATAGKSLSENSEGNWARNFTPTFYPSGLPLDYADWIEKANTNNIPDYDAGYVYGNFLTLNAFVNLKIRIGGDN